MVRLGNFIKITNGFAFKSSEYSESGGRIVRITNVQKGLIEDNNPKFYPKNLLLNLDKYKVFEKDILVSLTGNVGRVGRFPKELLPAYINQRVCRVKSISKDLTDDYLFHILNSNDYENRAINSSTGIAQMNLSTKWIEEFKIPLPPLETQKFIAKILDDAQALKQKTKQQLKEYDSLVQSIFLDMFGDPAFNSANFPELELHSLASKKDDIKCGPFGTQLSKDEYTTEGVPIWGIPQINSNFIKKPTEYVTELKASELHSYSVESDDIVMSRKGNVGICSKYPLGWPTGILHSDALRIRCDTKKISPDFLIWQFRISRNLITQVNNVSSGAIMAGINVTKLKGIRPIVPPIELQNQFAKKIALIEKQKGLAKLELKESEDLFHCLMQKAFKGELI